MTHLRKYTFIAVVASVVLMQGLISQHSKQAIPSPLLKVTGSPSQTHLNINRIASPVWNNGQTDRRFGGGPGDNGLIYPKGSGKLSVYASGFLWGFRYGGGGEIRAGGTLFMTGMQGGRILPGMIPQDVTDEEVRIYRVRRDISPGLLSAPVTSEQLDGEGTPQQIYSQYHKDWLEWPGHLGAPYEDVNANGSYDPTTDVPGFPGADQTIWYVANDLIGIVPRYHPNPGPSGIEMQVTMWAYLREGPLDNVSFRKYLFTNRSSVVFDSMYVSVVVDPDIGNFQDDLAGCDTTKSLGFAYNGFDRDIIYDPLPPPAVGYDFLQGPIVDGSVGDSAISRGRRVYGKKNLPMSSFSVFSYPAPDPAFRDPDPYDDPVLWYNLMRGRVSKTGAPYTTPDGNVTSYVFSGDVIARTGWLDGDAIPPGDRRMMLNTGPFILAPGDTQEVVAAVIAAGGEGGIDRISAVSLLKYYDDFAQIAYDNFFDLPQPPPEPRATASGLDREVILSWGHELDAVADVESFAQKGYTFQGYNLYQFPQHVSSIAEATRLGTYDIVDNVTKIFDRQFDATSGSLVELPVQFGTDNGLIRDISITTDILNGNYRLYNGTTYRFAVTAYAYNADPTAVPRVLESAPKIISVIPHQTDPGDRFEAVRGDTITGVTHINTSGGILSGGRVQPEVVNQALLTGSTYKVVFSSLSGATVWHLLRENGSAVDTLARSMSDQSGDILASPVIDGIRWRVFGAEGINNFLCVSNGQGLLDPPEPGAFGFAGFPTPDGGIPTTAQQVAAGRWGIHTGPDAPSSAGGTRVMYADFLSRSLRNDDMSRFVPDDWEMRFTASGSWSLRMQDARPIHVPFELWNIGVGTPDDASDDYKVVPWIYEFVNDSAFALVNSDHPVSGADNDPYTDMVYWMIPPDTSPGTAGYDTFESQLDLISVPPTMGSFTGIGYAEALARMVLVNYNGSSVVLPDSTFPSNINQLLPETGTIFRIATKKPNSPNDVFTIDAPGITYERERAVQDADKINVFPNPYYGTHSLEPDKYRRFVTFSHLPPRAVLRIFTLAGVMVRRIDKDSNSQFEQWDLKNEQGLPVGSGMYIAHIELPDIGTQKILKIAIVQEQQILDRY